ncbi:MAG: OOP family OmpA-OmpF porin [Arcticibacterium sp.]|jgi:OOP family OmpA-OmpF porin
MNKFTLAGILLLGHLVTIAQITPNPRVKKKSSLDTFINKIEITEDFTVVSMQFVSKSREDAIKDYLNNNLKEKEMLKRMDPFMRSLSLQQMMQQIGNSTISIQPTTFLKANDGRTFKFIKASNIPQAPDRKEIEPDSKYFFKVFFEKLDPGIQIIDLIENDSPESEGFSFWNFYGVNINNPGEGEEAKSLVEKEVSVEEITIRGKVYDSATDKPISAKIVCALDRSSTAFDSTQTSRSGYYEFLIHPGAYEYLISAEGFKSSSVFMDLSNIRKDFSRDIYLEPLIAEQLKFEGKEDLGAVSDTLEMEQVNKNTFRLNYVYFPSGKADILEDSYPELQKVIQMMEQKRTVKIRVDGHTDNQGDSHLNKILSIDRAKNVRDYLVAGGIDAERISFKGWGDTRAIETNGIPESRQKNRRVEIVILEESF